MKQRIFAVTICSQCGGEFGPGYSGFSRRSEHRPMSMFEALLEALGMIEANARMCFTPFNQSATQEEFEAVWADEDLIGYAAWHRLTKAAKRTQRARIDAYRPASALTSCKAAA